MIRGFLLLVLATILWGGNYVAGRVLAPAMPALVLNGFRWTLSALELYFILRVRGERIPWRGKWKEFSILGLSGMFVFSGLTYLGLHSIPAAEAGMISGLIPVAILVFGVFLLNDQGSWMSWLGSIVSIVGVVVLLGTSAKGAGLSISVGDLELLVAAAAWGLYTVLGKKYGTHMNPLTLTAGAAIFGAIPSDVAGLATFRPGSFHMHTVDWIALIYVSTAASVIAYFVWTLGVEWVGASRAAPWMNLLPVWTTLSGIVLLGERLSVMQLIGGALVVLGAVLAGRRRSTKQRAAT